MYKLIEEFYTENRRLLVNSWSRRAGSPENAEDILQEAFFRALKYKDSFNPERQEIGAWFNRIMNNTFVAFKRDERLEGMSVEYNDETHAETYEMSQTDADLTARIIDEINKKDGDVRDTLYLFFVKEFKPTEVRDILDIPYRTIQSYIYRFKGEMIGVFGDD